MRSFFFSVFALLSIVLVAQSSVMKITGSATSSVRPTEAIVTLTVRTTADSYSAAIQQMFQRVSLLTSEMEFIGFKEEEIITSSFSINKRISYGQNRSQEEVFDAYQSLRVRFKQTEARLLEVLNKSTSSEAAPEIAIAFDLDSKRKKEVKNQLIKLAIQDARQKAKLIASETGYKITGVQLINYGAVRYADNPLLTRERLELQVEGVLSNIEVDNLSYSETIEITYRITNE